MERMIEKNSTLPKVSCMCITYGRTKVLDEAVYSFLHQDYPGEKELVILNDYDELELVGDFPNVTIYNEKIRYDSLGRKTNECISRCSGDIVVIWDDDDISLPHRLSVAVANIGIQPLFKPNKIFFYSPHTGMELQLRSPNGCGAFTKAAWQEVNGYPEKNSGLDLVFERRLLHKGMYGISEVENEDATYIYRWFAVEGYHTSAYGTGNGFLEAQQYVKSQKIGGTYEIVPQWREDYVKLTQEALHKSLL